MPDTSSDLLLIDFTEAARRLSIGKSLLWAMHSSGRLGPLPIRLSRRTLLRVDELDEWVRCDCPVRDRWLSLKESER